MIGLAVGVVASAVMFTFFGKDERAVKEHKQKKMKEKQQRQNQIKKRQQQLKKIENDPELKKKRQQRVQAARQKKAQMKQKLFKNMSAQDRSIFEKYMEQQRKKGKSDQQIMKDATSQAGLLMFGLFLTVIFLIIALAIVLKGGDQDFVKFFQGLKSLLYSIFPKLKSAHASTADINAQGIEL